MYRIQRTAGRCEAETETVNSPRSSFVELQVDESGNSRYRMNECIWSDEDTGTKKFSRSGRMNKSGTTEISLFVS